MSEWTRQEEEDEMEGGRAAPGRRGWTTGCATGAGGSETEEGTSEKEKELSLAFAWGREGGGGCGERVDKGQHAGRK